jgi:uncharacterized protein (DUF2062 family)
MWNWLKKKLPTEHDIRQHKYLRVFGKIIHSPNYWHMHTECVARAFACGLFSGFMPIPFQMVLAAALAIVSRANLFIAVILVWFSNPLTIPPIFYFCYRVGRWVLHAPKHPFKIELSLQWLQTTFLIIWKPLLVGSVVCGIIAALLGYFGVKIVRYFMPGKH